MQRSGSTPKRLAVVVALGILAYRVAVWLVASHIPGEPHYGYSFFDWVRWSVEPVETGIAAVATLVVYALCFWATFRLSMCQLAVWGWLLGAYLALVVSLDLVARMDALPFPKALDNGVGAFVSELLLFVLFPAGLALLIHAIGKVTAGRVAPGPTPGIEPTVDDATL